jgi:hypothetical protein
MKNRYEQAADQLIANKQEKSLHNITNRDGQPASWDDNYWLMFDNDGRKQSVSFNNIVTMPTIIRGDVPDYAKFDDKIRHVLMCFALDKKDDYGVINSVDNNVRSARHLVARANVFSFTQKKLNQVYKENKKSWLHFVSVFIKWCQQQGIIPLSIKPPILLSSKNTDALLENREKRMPDERALWAIGAIRNEIIPKKHDIPPSNYNCSLRDELTISCVTIALGSPQRIAAEQFTLSKQTLKSRTVNFKGKPNVIHWLDWTGSKGYKDNRKHFFDAMAEPISQVLDYWCHAGEPARILCRFYENPNQPLTTLLGDYQSKSISKFDLDKPVNMFALGFILGFYDDGEQEVKVNLSFEHKQGRHCISKKICDLELSDKILMSKRSPLLLGQLYPDRYSKKTEISAMFGGVLTIAEFQKRWIEYIKLKVPTFPYRIVGENKVKLSNTLFNLTGKQVSQEKTSITKYPFGKSFFAICSSELSDLLINNLKPRGSKQSSIFSRHGFSSDIRITPHQLRHWSNTKMQESELSDEVIAMVSGRVDVNQNAVYDHTNESDKVAQISNIISKEKTPEEMKKEVRVVGHKAYQDATGKIATVTATGICSQDLTVSPCTYLNDFITHCSLCSSSCHFAHDEKAIDILQKDLKYQQTRLDNVKSNPKLNTNTRLQDWYKTHHSNAIILEQLLELMKREDVEIGTGIRYVKTNNTFRLAYLKERKVEEVKALLPNSEIELERLLQSINYDQGDSQTANHGLSNLLSQFGIQGVF